MDEGFNALATQPALLIPLYFTWSVTYFLIIAGAFGYIAYKPGRKPYKADNVEFVIVTVANNKVKNTLMESLTSLRRRFRDKVVWVVVDEGAELIPFLNSLSFSDPFLRLVVVPKEYLSGRRGKVRAMSYFVKYFVNDDVWYVFLDDDNIVLNDDFLYEIPYYEEKGYVAFNPILKPRKSRSVLAYVIDWFRYFNDLTIYRFFTGFLGIPLLGLHGELLGVKGSVLSELDLTFNSITEDFRIAAELVKKGYKTWQSSTVVSIKSPNSIKDFQMQRARWFKGLIHDLKYAPLAMKVLVMIKSTLWVVNVVAIAIVLYYWPQNIYFLAPFAVSALYHWSAYIYGVVKSRKIKYLMLTPFAWLIEVSSLARVFQIRDFYVIQKD